MEIKEKIINLESNNLYREIAGNMDENFKEISKIYDVDIVVRDNKLKLIGKENEVKIVSNIINEMIKTIKKEGTVNKQKVNYLLDLYIEKYEGNLDKLLNDIVALTANGRTIKPKTLGQKRYIDNIRKNDIVFSIGPAGTGKTYLAVAMAVNAFRKKEVERIILTRPAVEAGEKLGFLPGDMQDKVDPYLRPLYDALFDIMGPDNYMNNLEKGLIEIAPLAYMRGRTIDSAFIILDEAQNTTKEQMKMFLTRLGYGSKAIVTGDVTQVDLPRGKKSGLKQVEKVLKNIPGIGFMYFDKKDVVRHKLVQNIISAYEKYEGGKKSDGSSNR
ncbi:MAG: PhoH family protein [Bacillota bacterium]|nr:PhoH family protein [Bacillota bacterium]